MIKDYSILIGGAAGQGSRKAGLIIAKLFAFYGYRIFIYDDYQSLIRGGHNFSQIRASAKKVLSHRKKIDFLLALDENTLQKHRQDLDKKGIVFSVDPSLKTLTQKAGGQPIMENTALIAAFAKSVGLDWPTLEEVLKKEFKKFRKLNLKVAKAAFEKTKKLFSLPKLNQKPLPLVTGNQAVGLGAVKVGLKFYSAYPMTPASGILHFLAARQKEFKMTVVQLENEIAVVNAAIGAAYAGARAMVGTSGGGFALMTEALSLAAQSETPLVVVESQRPGPATGVPTYTAQADLLFALNSGHGDFLRFVIAPGDAEQSFYWAGQILNLAWQYQTPAILLIDKEISESTFSFDDHLLKVQPEKPHLWQGSGQYERYKITANGISPLAFPGQKGIAVKATSNEHDELGLSIENEKKVQAMQEKRLRKFRQMEKAVEKLPAVEIFGEKTAKKAMIVWGSTIGPAIEAAEKLGFKVVQPVILQPFPKNQFQTALKGVEKLVLLETNASGQLGQVLACHGYQIDKQILKYNGRPFLPAEIEAKLKDG